MKATGQPIQISQVKLINLIFANLNFNLRKLKNIKYANL